jgi:hypothetical protein
MFYVCTGLQVNMMNFGNNSLKFLMQARFVRVCCRIIIFTWKDPGLSASSIYSDFLGGVN